MPDASKMPARIWAETTDDAWALWSIDKHDGDTQYVRADIAEQLAAALRGIIPFIPKSSASEGGPNARSANVAAADKVRQALSAFDASNGDRQAKHSGATHD